MEVYYNSQDLKYKEPFGAVELGGKVIFRLYARDVDGAVLRLWTGENGESLIEMRRDGDFFTAEAVMPSVPCLVWYFFKIYEGGRLFYYGNNEEELGGEGRITDYEPPSFQITVYRPLKTPDWFKNAIVYYIFPDRFYKGSDFEERKAAATRPENWKGPGQYFEKNWYERPYYKKNEDGTIKEWQFYGGTLKGIMEKIPYIKSLGCDVIYLCPIFKASSNHRYDTADYMSIDPLLGDEESFKQLCDEVAAQDMHIVLDGVFSHTGCDSIYFDKYGNFGGKDGAYEHPDSKYYPWYKFYEGGGYESWWGDPNLPNVIEEEPSHKEFICGKDGVLNKWMDLGASGWRLDVADELPDGFIKDIRNTMKSRPDGDDTILIGEVWEDASRKVSYDVQRQFIWGEELDSVMNYPFRSAIIEFLTGKSTNYDFCRRVMSIYENYPREILLACLTMLGSHDRERPLTALAVGGFVPEEFHYSYRLGATEYELAKMRLKTAAVLQYALPGVPVIYYGDEAGAEGHFDPYNRGSFPWDKEDREIQEHYRKLGKIYKQHPGIHGGSFKVYPIGEDVIGIEREDELEKLVVIVNRNWQKSIYVSIDTGNAFMAEDLITGQIYDLNSGHLTMNVKPTNGLILLMK